ncbi:hypothetical protein HMPREF9946_01440 [Acetobacteraceae bacterium AT-5844]|nr:hypothetical protein HMPREF9946_01440 [Acetobacteraceae bacterium AT-5844]
MIRHRTLPILALAGSLLLGACQNPDGSTDWGSTLALGAGVGIATALVAGAASDDGPRYRRGRYYDRGYYGPPPRHYHRGYYNRRGW